MSNDPLLPKITTLLTPLTTQFDTTLFLTQLAQPSKIYKFTDLLSALSIVSSNELFMGDGFYLGEEDVDLGWEYGMVNLAAFLSQCMKETIIYDACDENNWDQFNNQYPLSNACGQLGQSYQEYNCPVGEEHMQCPIDPSMQITATTHAHWYGAPPGLFCGPRSVYPFTGFWDYNYWCNNPWNTPPEYCDLYEGQKAGRFDNTVAVANRAGRTDVEGCCWWGRGVIQTTGICNYGKLNYFLGARAAQEGRSSRYPNIDFCKTPDAICSDPNHPELKWIAGFFYWIESVQKYSVDGWYYLAELHKFVNGGMTDTRFIDSVSGIVNRGCHNPPCSTGEVDGLIERRANFDSVLKAMGLPSGLERPPSTLPPVPSGSSAVEVGDANATFDVTTSDSTTSSPMLTQIINELNHKREVLEQKILSYTNVQGVRVQSDMYTFDGFIESLAYAIDIGYGGKNFYTDDASLKIGLTNVAVFLAQANTESIQYNACEEFHLDAIHSKYAISNSCGQFGSNYQDYRCEGLDMGVECPVSPTMSTEAVGGGKYGNERPRFYCRSRSQEPFTGVFDSRTYSLDSSAPYPNAANRTDVEGCCFWGRGALMTKGVCMLGKLNKYLGSGAAREGRMTMYPEIDFCSNPDFICKDRATSTIVWDVALFEWVERIQSHNKNGWSYIEKLHEFVDGGMTDVSFINTVSEILTNALGNNVPSTGHRWANFNTLLTQLQLKEEPMFGSFPGALYIWSGAKPAIITDGWFGVRFDFAIAILMFGWMIRW